MKTSLHRRQFLAGTALAAAALPVAGAARGASGPAKADNFQFEIQRSEADWRARLSKDEYNILRKGSTELPKTSTMWNEDRLGGYICKGCDLPVYISVWKAPLDKGWAFYKQSVPNAVLMGIDGLPPQGMIDMSGPGAMIEVHCRRCGSHLGHILKVEGKVLHCINGTSLIFTPTDA